MNAGAWVLVWTGVVCALSGVAIAEPGCSNVSPSRLLQAAPSGPSGYARFPQGPVVVGPDETLAPYFHVDGADRGTDALPLKKTSAKVDIAGVIARVRVQQVYENAGRQPIEATYVFPASTRAAVHGMRMKIGERTIVANIDRRQAARQTYEAAKQAGQRASLLEQQRPNVFTMNVANLMPGDRIEVELDYSEMIVPEEGVYEFVYPAVVGPRYGGGAHPEKDTWISNPYLSEGKAEPYQFGLELSIETGIPLKQLSSPSHRIAANYQSASSARVKLDQEGGGNKDFVLEYRLAGDRVETGVLLWEGQKESFFSVLIEPPKRVTADELPAREYVFLLDVSGSMHGFPLDTAKGVMKELLGRLKPTDTFNIVFFSGASFVLSPSGSLPATESNVRSAITDLMQRSAGGGTELMAGLQTSYNLPRRTGVSRTVVVVTDGYVGVEAQVFKLIRERLNEANVFAFGIGSSVNRGLIEGMARAGQGEPFIVLNPTEAAVKATKFRKYIEEPVLMNIAVRFDGFGAYEVAPGKLPDLMAQRPIVLFGKYRGGPKGRVMLTGRNGKGAFSTTVDISKEAVKTYHEPLKWLWARKWVALLEDEHHLTGAKELEDAITDLGLAYTLLTPFTSFVAIDSEVANKTGGSVPIKQPLPLPEGVSNMAVGHGTAALRTNGFGLGRAERKAEAQRPEARPRHVPTPPIGGLFGASPSPTPQPAEDLSTAKDERVDAKAAAAEPERGKNAASLTDAIRRVLTESGCSDGSAELVVRVTVDSTGRVTKIDHLRGSKKLWSCAKEKLMRFVGLETTLKSRTLDVVATKA